MSGVWSAARGSGESGFCAAHLQRTGEGVAEVLLVEADRLASVVEPVAEDVDLLADLVLADPGGLQLLVDCGLGGGVEGDAVDLCRLGVDAGQFDAGTQRLVDSSSP
jgi:hypothetical protein